MKEFNQSYIGIRKDLLCFIHGSDNVVLDVGCANGNNGKYLLDLGIAKEVYGVEFDREMAAETKRKYTTVYLGDLNESIFLENILRECPKVDYIIFGDILEHLIDPDKTLKSLSLLLRKGGKTIISLPNIAHVELFIQVYLKGTWPRNPRGIFDKTHLRWFTKKDVFALVESSGLKVDKYKRKYRARDAKGSKFTWKYRLLKWLNKDWVTFQHIIICSKND